MIANTPRTYDHLVLCVNALEHARDFYKNLGFTMTPTAVHPFGTHNSLVQLQGNFLEILSVNDASLIGQRQIGKFSFATFNRDFLADLEGLSMVVFQGGNAASDAAEFADKGLSDFAPFDFSRSAKLPTGEEVTVSFSLAFVARDDMPKAAFFTCHQHAPEYFWKPEYQRHENTATAITETMMVAENPAQYRDYFAKLLNSTAEQNLNGTIQFATNGGSLTVSTPDQWQSRFANEPAPDLTHGPRMAGYTIQVDSLEKATGCLSQNNICHAQSGLGLFISAKTAHGCVIEFTEQT